MSPTALLRTAPLLLRSRLGKGIAWIAVDTIAARGIPLVVMLLIARSLGARDFGALTLVLGTITLFGSVVAESVRLTAVKHVASTGVARREELGRIIGLVSTATLVSAVLIAIVLCLMSTFVATSVLKTPALAPGLRAGAWLVFFDLLAAAQKGILTGIGATRSMALASLVSGLVVAALSAIIEPGAGVDRYVLAFTIASVVGGAMRGAEVWSRLREHRVRPSLRLTTAEWTVLWSFSVPAILSSIMWAPVNWIGMAMLARQPEGLAGVGIIGIATQWFSCLLFLPNIVANAALPRFAEAGDPHRSAWILRICIRGILCLVVPAALLIGCLADWILHGFYGPSFAHGAATLHLVLAAAVPASITNLLEYALAARDLMWSSFAVGALWAVVYLASAYLGLALGWGVNAIGFAMLCAYSVKMGRHIWMLQHASGARS